MKSFRERNLTAVAITAVVGTALLIIGTFRIADLESIAGSKYSAEFAEAGGLKTGDPIEVAGVIVGEVTGMALAGDRIVVDFTAKNVNLGADTTAEIKTGSLLGARFVQLTPLGDGELDERIPLARTSAPYDLSSELIGIAGHTRKLDLDTLSDAMDTFSSAISPSTEELGPAMSAITDLSKVVSDRDQAVRALFARAQKVTGTFRHRTAQITKLVQDGSLLLQELLLRQNAIRSLLTNTRAVADQVSALVKENQTELRPAMARLEKVLDVLVDNQDNIRVAVNRVSSFVTGLGEGVASGPWFAGRIDLTTGVGPNPNLLDGLDGLLLGGVGAASDPNTGGQQ